MTTYLVTRCRCGCGGITAAAPATREGAPIVGQLLMEWTLEGEITDIVRLSTPPVLGCKKQMEKSACITALH